jgi:uncharacterized small protein (DUF1192 family)
MDIDEFPPNTAGDPLAAIVAQDLDPLSVKELDDRIVVLEREIVRTRAKRDRAVDHRASADTLFKS